MSLTQADVVAALDQVMDPELHISLVKAGMVQNVRVEGDKVSLKIELTTPACPMKEQIREEAEAALNKIEGLGSFEIEWGARVRKASSAGSMDQLLPGVRHVILVGAGKGGVGKSTVSLNLAVALRQAGAKVGLLDTDFYGPSLPTMTLTGDTPPVSKDGKILEPVQKFGIKLMSLGYLVEPDQALIWRGPMLHGALLQLIRDVNWGELDYLILDLPPGTGDVALTLSQNIRATGSVLVTTPQDVALADVVRAKQMFDKVNIPVLGLVENMSQFICPNCEHATPIFHHGGGKKLADAYELPFLGEIPLHLSVRQGGDDGLPITESAPDSAEAQAFKRVAETLAGRISMESMKVRLPVLKQAGAH